VLNGIKNGLKKTKEVRLIGFGTFSVRQRKARKGRNPQTGSVINIKASKAVKFTAGQDFKNSINK
jgi:DNA-binding protein HU-beta